VPCLILPLRVNIALGAITTPSFLLINMLDLVKYPLGFDPGSEWNYHVSSNMLGYMVERISGQSLQDYVKKEILKPLGMNDTGCYYSAERIDRFVKPYTVEDRELQPRSNLYAEGAVSGSHPYAEGAIG